MQEPESPTIPATEPEIDLWALAQELWQKRLLIVAVTLSATIAATVHAYLQPNIYEAKATIMPVDSSSDRLSSALSSLGALGSLASKAGGLKGSVSDKFEALLDSRTMSEKVITKYDLLPVLFPERWDSARSVWRPSSSPFFQKQQSANSKPPTLQQAFRRMHNMVVTTVDPKAGLVDIKVEHSNPEAAANIANYFVIELNAYLQENSFTSAKQNRAFLESQIQGVSRELTKIETELKDFQAANKLVSLDAQTQASVQAYATLKSQLTAKEMEISLQERSASDSDILLLGLRQELSQLQEKLAALESGESGGLISFKDAPEIGMRFAQLSRDLLVRQKIYELLTQQYELAKIEEAKEALTFQLLDKAIPPDFSSKPNRVVNILLATLMAFFLTSTLVLIFERAKKFVDERCAQA